MIREVYINVGATDIGNIPVGFEPVALAFYSDEPDVHKRAIRSGAFDSLPGRLHVVIDGPDPPDQNGATLWLCLPGYQEVTLRGRIVGNEFVFDDGSLGVMLVPGANRFRKAPPEIPVIQRAPLPPFDRLSYDPDTGAPLPVYTTPNGPIPPRKTPGYIRADLWGVTLPGLPKIPGGATGAAQSRMLSYLLQQYPDEWKADGCHRHASYGYDDFFLSWPDCRSFGLSIADYVRLTKGVQGYGLRACHFFRSKDHDGANPNPSDVYPVIDALLADNAIDGVGVHAWEQSLFNSPEHTRATIDSDATHYPQIRWAVHLQEGYASFGPNGDDQGPKFWKANIAVGVRLLLYQCVATWSAGMMAARGNDVSVRFAKGGTWGLPETVNWVPFELIATRQFNNELDGDGREADEAMGNLKAYECLGSPGPVPASGYGQGGSKPDGWNL